MSFSPCPNASEDCKYAPDCYADLHHIYYPRKRYTSGIERQFRNLPENKDVLCRAEHDEIHATERPPVKPSRELMIQAIASHMVQGEVA